MFKKLINRFKHNRFLENWESINDVHSHIDFINELLALGNTIPNDYYSEIDTSTTYLSAHYRTVEDWLKHYNTVYNQLLNGRLSPQKTYEVSEKALYLFLRTIDDRDVSYVTAQKAVGDALTDIYTLLADSTKYSKASRLGVLTQIRELCVTGINFYYIAISSYYT